MIVRKLIDEQIAALSDHTNGNILWLVYIYCIYCDLMQIYVYGEYLN